MPRPSKIQDKAEFIRWYKEGKTYAWMIEEYKRKYHTPITMGAFVNARRKYGLKPRTARNTDLIPWDMSADHKTNYLLFLLRLEGQHRAGRKMTRTELGRLDRFHRHLDDANAVVHYDRDSEEGFYLVPREPGDTDIVRQPPPSRRTRRKPRP